MVVGRASEGDGFLNLSAGDYRDSKKFRNLCPEPAAKAMRLLKCHRIDGNALLDILYHSVSDG
jgi:hypothetical protein